MDPKLIARFKKRLEEERHRILDDRTTAEDELIGKGPGIVDRSELSDDMSDDAADYADRGRTELAEANTEQILSMITRALQKIEEGTYGLSDIDGSPIPVERLNILPYALTTVSQEERLEPKLDGILLAALVIVLDQWTKSIVSHSFAVSESRTVLQGFFDLTYVQNRGGAFGIMQGSGLGLVAVGVIVAGAIIVSALRGPTRPEALIAIGMALPLGGTIGNMIDRLRLGYVVDFFDVYVGSHHWPVFNVADSAICIGVGLIALWILRRPEPSLDESAATKTEG